MNNNEKVIRDDEIRAKVPGFTKQQALDLANHSNLSLGIWLQLFIQEQHTKAFPNDKSDNN